jgi:hypothetical protein
MQGVFHGFRDEQALNPSQPYFLSPDKRRLWLGLLLTHAVRRDRPQRARGRRATSLMPWLKQVAIDHHVRVTIAKRDARQVRRDMPGSVPLVMAANRIARPSSPRAFLRRHGRQATGCAMRKRTLDAALALRTSGPVVHSAAGNPL